tara:strand:- start:4268 stop:4495 length:228 start_codon:yes stop_codon:yes gene_type:complete
MKLNRKWAIINVSDITDEMISKSIQSGDLTKNINEDKVILKWDGNTPECFEGMTTYSHSEILEILNGDDWTNGMG